MRERFGMYVVNSVRTEHDGMPGNRKHEDAEMNPEMKPRHVAIANPATKITMSSV